MKTLTSLLAFLLPFLSYSAELPDLARLDEACAKTKCTVRGDVLELSRTLYFVYGYNPGPQTEDELVLKLVKFDLVQQQKLWSTQILSQGFGNGGVRKIQAIKYLPGRVKDKIAVCVQNIEEWATTEQDIWWSYLMVEDLNGSGLFRQNFSTKPGFCE